MPRIVTSYFDGRVRFALGLATTVILAVILAKPLHAQPPTPRGSLPEADVVWDRQFSSIASVRELSDGRVLVADRTERRLYLADPGSGEIHEIGGQGEGPGEYRLPGRLYPLAGDSTLFTDFQSRRWLVLEGERIVRTVGSSRQLLSRLGPNLSGADREGRVAGIVGVSYGSTADQLPVGDRSVADSLQVVVGRLENAEDVGLAVDTVDMLLAGKGRWGVRRSRSGRYVSIRRAPLATEDQAWLFPDSWIALAFTDPYRVFWRDPEGSWVRGDVIDAASIEADSQERCFAVLRQGSGECDLALFPEGPERVPPFLPNALVPAPDGTLLVRRTLLSGDQQQRYDQVGRDAELVRVVIVPKGDEIVGSGSRGLYVVSTDDFGLQTLRRIPWDGTP